MAKGSMDAKWFAVENMLRDGVDIMTILKWSLVRMPLNDLQIIHQCHLRDRAQELQQRAEAYDNRTEKENRSA